MKAGTPPQQPEGTRRCPPMTGNLTAGRSLLPVLLWAQHPRAVVRTSAVALAMLVPALSAQDAGVWPAPNERQPGRALPQVAAQRAKAMATWVKAVRVRAEQGAIAALPLFKDVMSLDPGNSALAGRVAELAAAAGQPNESRRLLEEAIQGNPASEGPAVALARFLVSRQQESVQSHAEALTLVRQLQTKFPGSAEVCGLAVRLYVNDQRREEAQNAVRQAIQHGSRSPDFWMAMTSISREAFPLDDPDTRTAHLAIVSGCMEKAAALAPENAAVLEAAADFYAQLQSQQKATAYYQRLTALQPGNLAARRKLGQCLRLTGDTAGAQRLFEELLRIDESDSVAHRALASMLGADGKPREALRHRMELLRIKGGTAGEYLKMAAQLDEAGMPDERRLTLERGIFACPQSPRLAIAYAGALHRAGRIKEATAGYEQAVLLAAKHDPDALDDTYLIARAECARDAGELETAAIHFRKAIDKTPKGKSERAVPAYCGLAMLWLQEGVKLDEARELLRLASALKKNDGAVTRALALYEEKKAVRDAEQSVKKNP